MCDVINSDQPVNSESSEKMKRMANALKAIGGWISYFMGIFTLALGTLTPFGTDLFIIIIGTIITFSGLILLHQHVKHKKLTGKERLVKGVKYIGAILLIPGLSGIAVIGYSSPVISFFSTLFFTGLIIFISSFVLKKIWGLKKVKNAG